MGIPADVARRTLRISLGRYTTKQDIARASDILIKAMHELSAKAA